MNETKVANRRPAFAGPGIKALIVAVLVLAFLIPLSLVQRIVEERRSTRDQAEASIIDPAGGRPGLFGPFIVLPYDLRKGKELVEGEILVLPDTLSISSSLTAEERSRGVFSATVMEADVALAGTLTASATDAAPYGARLRWDLARVGFELADLRSLAETPRLVWGGRELALHPDARGGRAFDKAISTRVPLVPGESLAFTAAFKLRGGSSLSFLEPAGTVVASISGRWPSPSFFGYSAPTERSVAESGFRARWYMPESSQGLPRAFDATGMERGKLNEAAFGVRLLSGVDAYDMAWRAMHYGLLFIVVPFAVLFLFELLSRSRVHPVQYVLIGLANCLFYLLLLSLSEIIGFGWAYASAASVCALLCGLYARAALKARQGFLLLPALALLYAYLYVVLSSEDYALLLGSFGLLVLLVAAMVATRKVDWYGGRDKGAPAPRTSDELGDIDLLVDPETGLRPGDLEGQP
jgi:inner membrane protein